MASGLTKTADTGVGSRIMGPKQVTEMKVARGSSESERAGEGHKRSTLPITFFRLHNLQEREGRRQRLVRKEGSQL